MNVSRANSEGNGFTLLELLVIILIIVVLAAFVLPTRRDRNHSSGVICMSHLRQIAISFITYATDNTNQFPMQVSVRNGGTMELIQTGHVFTHFEKIQKYWPTRPEGQFYKILVCPADKSRQAATNAEGFGDLNISYFVNADAQCLNQPARTVLLGDRDLKSNGQAVKPGLLAVTTNMDLGWSGDLHGNFGNLAFADGHVERVNINRLNAIFAFQPALANSLAIL